MSPWGKTQRNIPKKARDLTNQICAGVSVYSACDWLWEKVVPQKKKKKRTNFAELLNTHKIGGSHTNLNLLLNRKTFIFLRTFVENHLIHTLFSWLAYFLLILSNTPSELLSATCWITNGQILPFFLLLTLVMEIFITFLVFPNPTFVKVSIFHMTFVNLCYTLFHLQNWNFFIHVSTVQPYDYLPRFLILLRIVNVIHFALISSTSFVPFLNLSTLPQGIFLSQHHEIFDHIPNNSQILPPPHSYSGIVFHI